MKTKELTMLEEVVAQSRQAALMMYEDAHLMYKDALLMYDASLRMKEIIDSVTRKLNVRFPELKMPIIDAPGIEFGLIDFVNGTVKVIKS
ncbi:MAG TPA: hypothetical protein DEQ30_05005 [Porphyromonadaceae bacterium]|nr:hypothetical protein [Porphyromonadaceae bacterium]